MTAALLALALLAQPENRALPVEAQAIAVAESGGRTIISRRRYNGSRDHGVMQINARDLSKRRLARLLTLAVNIDRGAYLLAKSRERCSRPRNGCRCLEAHYCWRSATWCSRVHRIWRRLLERLSVRGVA